MSAKVMRVDGRRTLRLKLTDSRGKDVQRLTVRIKRGDKTVMVRHPSLRKGRGTVDLHPARALKGRYQVVVVFDDGTTLRRGITFR
jgi:hypothetical protein